MLQSAHLLPGNALQCSGALSSLQSIDDDAPALAIRISSVSPDGGLLSDIAKSNRTAVALEISVGRSISYHLSHTSLHFHRLYKFVSIWF